MMLHWWARNKRDMAAEKSRRRLTMQYVANSDVAGTAHEQAIYETQSIPEEVAEVQPRGGGHRTLAARSRICQGIRRARERVCANVRDHQGSRGRRPDPGGTRQAYEDDAGRHRASREWVLHAVD